MDGSTTGARSTTGGTPRRRRGRWMKTSPCSLYVPAPILGAGRNELSLLELHGASRPVTELRDGESL